MMKTSQEKIKFWKENVPNVKCQHYQNNSYIYLKYPEYQNRDYEDFFNVDTGVDIDDEDIEYFRKGDKQYFEDLLEYYYDRAIVEIEETIGGKLPKELKEKIEFNLHFSSIWSRIQNHWDYYQEN